MYQTTSKKGKHTSAYELFNIITSYYKLQVRIEWEIDQSRIKLSCQIRSIYPRKNVTLPPLVTEESAATIEGGSHSSTLAQ